MTRHFTGRHMLALIVCFFAVVIAVNMVMATFASRTFGGTVVDNSYVASQRFNRWLDAADQQQRQGWTVIADRVGDRAEVSLGHIDGATLRAVAIHPLGRLPDATLHFRETSPGHYLSIETLPPGRWRLQLEVRRGAETAHFLDEVPA